MKKSLSALCLLLLLQAGAETVRFRSGLLLAAELSTRAPSMEKIDPLVFPGLPDNRIYAMLVLKTDPARRMSIYDYSLRAFGRDFPCVAVWQRGAFRFYDGNIDTARTALLYVLDAKQVGLNHFERLILKSNCPPEKFSEQPVLFTVRGAQPLTAPEQVSESGIMAVKK